MMFRHALPLIALLAATPALAGPREDVYSASLRCSAIADDRAWLNCYYGAAQPMRAELQLPAAPEAQTSLVPPPIGVPAARQPAVASAPQARGPVDRTMNYITGGGTILVNVAIKSYDVNRQGGFTVVLANGQVWTQLDDQARTVKWRNGPEAHKVTIWKGALNTFNLGFDNETDRYKVRRLK